MAVFSEREVPLSYIVAGDHTFRITSLADKDPNPLTQSIAGVGLLSSPVLIPLTKRSFRVVTGFRRLEAVRSLGWSDISCRLVKEDTPPLDCLKIAITDNTMQRSLNLAEQAGAVTRLSRLIPDPERLRAVAADLGLPAGRDVLDKLKLIDTLPPDIIESLALDRLGLAVAVELSTLNKSAAVGLNGLFQELRLGMNRQREVLLKIREIAARDRMTIEQVLAETDLQNIVSDSDTDRGLRIARLKDYLNRRRYPIISQAEASFARKVKRLKPGPKARIYPPENFEGSDFSVHLLFNSREDLSNHARLLQRIADSALHEKTDS